MSSEIQSQSNTVITEEKIIDICKKKFGRDLYINKNRCRWPCGVSQAKKDGKWSTKQCGRHPGKFGICQQHLKSIETQLLTEKCENTESNETLVPVCTTGL